MRMEKEAKRKRCKDCVHRLVWFYPNGGVEHECEVRFENDDPLIINPGWFACNKFEEY